jgi:hypothetical protein
MNILLYPRPSYQELTLDLLLLNSSMWGVVRVFNRVFNRVNPPSNALTKRPDESSKGGGLIYYINIIPMWNPCRRECELEWETYVIVRGFQYLPPPLPNLLMTNSYRSCDIFIFWFEDYFNIFVERRAPLLDYDFILSWEWDNVGQEWDKDPRQKIY